MTFVTGGEWSQFARRRIFNRPVRSDVIVAECRRPSQRTGKSGNLFSVFQLIIWILHVDGEAFGEDGGRTERGQAAVSGRIEHVGFAEEIDSASAGSDAVRLFEMRARPGPPPLG